jgi:hypothetical protein
VTLLAREFWSSRTLNGRQIDQVLHRTAQGVWVLVNGEKWVVPYRDDGEVVKAGVR